MREITIACNRRKALIFPNPEELAIYAAGIVADEMKKKPEFLLGLATGSTPVLMYRELARLNRAGVIDFSKVKTYNLDEYYPIDPKNPQSFIAFMKENLFDHVNLPAENIHIPCGNAPDADEEAKRYEKILLELGGVDLQVLGVGSDGHVGFNEPADIYELATHKVTLTEQTIKDNSRFFESVKDVPTHAITMGIRAIMQAKKCLFMATGKNKAKAVLGTLKEDPTPQCQASILQFHPDTVFLLDEEAASLL